jgi:hypothetical protein
LAHAAFPELLGLGACECVLVRAAHVLVELLFWEAQRTLAASAEEIRLQLATLLDGQQRRG